MLVFLKEYGEKREKVEEGKLNILKTMQEEKKKFLGSYWVVWKIKSNFLLMTVTICNFGNKTLAVIIVLCSSLSYY